jgi:CspA family cold shock protein
MMNGNIVWFSGPKGFGFVKAATTGDEYFVHFSNIEMQGYKSLNQNDPVTFDVELGPKGRPQAINVRVVK